MNNNIERLENEIKEMLLKSSVKTDLAHSESTRKLVLKLKPDADLALQIAALVHDIDRSVQSDYFNETKNKFDNFKQHTLIHCEDSAKIVVDLLKKYNFDEKFIFKVENLVLKHEFGGDVESDILMDADSLSALEGNLELYFERCGEGSVRKKVGILYNRMSDKAKEIARKFNYDNLELNRIFREEIGKK